MCKQCCINSLISGLMDELLQLRCVNRQRFLLEASASSADDAPASQCVMGTLLRPENTSATHGNITERLLLSVTWRRFTRMWKKQNNSWYLVCVRRCRPSASAMFRIRCHPQTWWTQVNTMERAAGRGLCRKPCRQTHWGWLKGWW